MAPLVVVVVVVVGPKRLAILVVVSAISPAIAFKDLSVIIVLVLAILAAIALILKRGLVTPADLKVTSPVIALVLTPRLVPKRLL